MTRRKISEEKRLAIRAAIESLVREGVEPTYVKVHKRVGGGSFDTIGPVVREWRAEQCQGPTGAVGPVPQEVTDLMASVAVRIWDAAARGTEQRSQERQQRFDEERSMWEAEREQLTQAADELADALAGERVQTTTQQEHLRQLMEERVELLEKLAEAVHVAKAVGPLRQRCLALERALAARASQEELLARLEARWGTTPPASAGTFNGPRPAADGQGDANQPQEKNHGL